VSRVAEAGVAVGVPTYTLLLGNLLFEGRSSEAEALQLEMERRGIEPDAKTTEVP
jgi:pentatricopeptide repeat protein